MQSKIDICVYMVQMGPTKSVLIIKVARLASLYVNGYFGTSTKWPDNYSGIPIFKRPD